MATDFIMPRVPGEQQNPYYAPAHQQRQQYRPQQAPFQPSPITTTYPASTHYNSPVSPLGTPGSISPTSSKNYITRQIRPLYVPAVLRPTEFPSKPAPPQPDAEDENDFVEDGLRPTSSFHESRWPKRVRAAEQAGLRGDSAKSIDSILESRPVPRSPQARPLETTGRVPMSPGVKCSSSVRADVNMSCCSPTTSLPFAITPPASGTLVTSPAATTAASAATSSATSTAPSKSRSTKMAISTPAACSAARATTAIRSSGSGGG
ncbi:hypothetical protein CHGG_03158 [Chaetomium globosum CBS 148.51]|uniref:Uncharacterized protein n=1 Tax=Chaetomium globosum (strain ATCC 6205 / CBS 148.51 / DSM 1962 / NBRC 6347 / NRRL 1970) TaxID=306901 RepID=Q2H9E6_CHAGB|nr:uncharacterized protein CHGG_03158 [Chaetomium globosum CBS 148.51]EAQ91223.1 hypothetical protein CHGG_03158 [Chaetomium globosum CBS 148.51]